MNLAKDYHQSPLVLGKVQTWAILEGLEGEETKKSVRRINIDQATSLNAEHYGIFHSVNSFYVKRRKDYLCRVNAWFVEVDSENKEDTLKQIITKGLTPSTIIESKRGYHVYWVCIDPSFELAKLSWDRIVKKGLIPFYNADPKASDICRILRRPGFLHWKDRSDPFLIKQVWSKKIGYTCREMEKAYPDVQEQKKHKRELAKIKREVNMGDSFWDNVYNLNCAEALTRLSGSQHVGGDTFTLVDNRNGTFQIHSNNKSTSCWVDEDGRIGSYESGGPTIAQWLNWYHKDYVKVASIIKEVFPECEKSNQMSLL